MNDRSEGYRIGYGNPPKETRRKKKQAGNPQRRGRKRPESELMIIDRLLSASVPIKLNGVDTQIPALGAIVLQILLKAMSGNARANRALLKYREFAHLNLDKELELIFVEDDYTRALARQLLGGDDGRV